MRKVLLDTNVYVGWLNQGLHEDVVLGRGFVRYLSAVVQLELRAGAVTPRARQALDQLVRAYAAGGRVVAPPATLFDRAGRVLQRLRARGREVRRASLVNDVLIALTARHIGATLCTADATDFEAIRAIEPFTLAVLRGRP